MEQITVTHVSKDFPDASGKPFHALRDISFTWTKGENISLMGESGSGKSTMARLLIGLERPTQGKILIDGEDTGKWTYNQWRDQTDLPREESTDFGADGPDGHQPQAA